MEGTAWPASDGFRRWQASQLTDAQLYELKQYYLLALDRLQVIEQESPKGLQEYVKVDKAAVTESLNAIDAEIDARTREHGPIIIAVFASREHGGGSATPPHPPKPEGPARMTLPMSPSSSIPTTSAGSRTSRAWRAA